MILKTLSIATLCVTACSLPDTETTLAGSRIQDPADLAGVWCTLQDGAFTADSECLTVYRFAPTDVQYTWGDLNGRINQTGSLINTSAAITFHPTVETTCYFGPNAGHTGYFDATTDPACLQTYQARAEFGDGTLTLHFYRDSVILSQME